MIRDRCVADGISTKHINRGTSSNTGRKFSNRFKKPLIEVMVKDSTYSTKDLKNRLLKEGFLEDRCYICGQLPFWNGKRLVLRIDHINGVRNDNRKENLRIVCPHCDSQLPTFSGRNTARYNSSRMYDKKPINSCSVCGVVISSIKNKSRMCRKCLTEHRKNDPMLYKKIVWPSKEKLEKMIKNEPMTTVASRLGVSDTAVKKRAKAYGITLPNRRGYWSKEKQAPSKSDIEKALYELPIRKMAKKRNTRQKEIIQTEIDKIDVFFTAEELQLLVSRIDKDIGIATIYRFLKNMKREGRLYSYVCDRKTTYSKDRKSHCHFICEKTGKITHFEIDSLDFLKDKIPGSIKSYQIEIRGICKDHDLICSKK
jgi:Fe2+ or Zn2+ uptake regulation protein